MYFKLFVGFVKLELVSMTGTFSLYYFGSIGVICQIATIPQVE